VEENSGGEEEQEELKLGLCLGSKKQQLLLTPAPRRILTARALQPEAQLSPDSSVSSSSPAAAGPTTVSSRAKAVEDPTPGASPRTVASGHPR
jgi:auxin-responsive protein IAA